MFKKFFASTRMGMFKQLQQKHFSLLGDLSCEPSQIHELQQRLKSYKQQHTFTKYRTMQD